MPISDSAFTKSGRDPSILLQEFLSFNFRTAYTLDELVAMMKSQGKDWTKKDVEGLLSALEYGGKVKSKTIDGETYYRYAKVMGNRLI